MSQSTNMPDVQASEQSGYDMELLEGSNEPRPNGFINGTLPHFGFDSQVDPGLNLRENLSFASLAERVARNNSSTTDDLLRKVGTKLDLRLQEQQSSRSISPVSSPGLLSPHGPVDSPAIPSPVTNLLDPSTLENGECVASMIGETQMSLVDRSEGLNLNEFPNTALDMSAVDGETWSIITRDALGEPLTSDAFTSDAPDSPLTSPHRPSDLGSVTSPSAFEDYGGSYPDSPESPCVRKARKLSTGGSTPASSAPASDCEEAKNPVRNFHFTKFGRDVSSFSGHLGGELDEDENSGATLGQKVPAKPSLSVTFPARSGSTELKIVKQPEVQHRARYQTEGSRGAIKDAEGKGYPVVQLFGYNKAPVVLQLFIGVETGKAKPHGFYQACKVRFPQCSDCSIVPGKSGEQCEERTVEKTTVIETTLEPENEMKATIDFVGILKLRNADVDARGDIAVRARKKSNRARLVVRANIPRPGGWLTLQTASHVISCSQPPGLPEITRMSLHQCGPEGNEDLFIVGKNFVKGTRVFFEQLDDNNMLMWRNESVIEQETFCNVHLICRVPPYQTEDIKEPVRVRVVVQVSGRSSEPSFFTYVAPSAAAPAPTAAVSMTTGRNASQQQPLHRNNGAQNGADVIMEDYVAPEALEMNLKCRDMFPDEPMSKKPREELEAVEIIQSEATSTPATVVDNHQQVIHSETLGVLTPSGEIRPYDATTMAASCSAIHTTTSATPIPAMEIPTSFQTHPSILTNQIPTSIIQSNQIQNGGTGGVAATVSMFPGQLEAGATIQAIATVAPSVGNSTIQTLPPLHSLNAAAPQQLPIQIIQQQQQQQQPVICNLNSTQVLQLQPGLATTDAATVGPPAAQYINLQDLMRLLGQQTIAVPQQQQQQTIAVSAAALPHQAQKPPQQKLMTQLQPQLQAVEIVPPAATLAENVSGMVTNPLQEQPMDTSEGMTMSLLVSQTPSLVSTSAPVMSADVMQHQQHPDVAAAITRDAVATAPMPQLVPDEDPSLDANVSHR